MALNLCVGRIHLHRCVEASTAPGSILPRMTSDQANHRFDLELRRFRFTNPSERDMLSTINWHKVIRALEERGDANSTADAAKMRDAL